MNGTVDINSNRDFHASTKTSTIVIARSNSIVEVYSAYLITTLLPNHDHFFTDPITELQEKDIKSITGQHPVIILGPHFRGIKNHQKIVEAVESLSCFAYFDYFGSDKSENSENWHPKVKLLQDMFLMRWTTQYILGKLGLKDVSEYVSCTSLMSLKERKISDVCVKICEYLDIFSFGYPKEHHCNFYAGIAYDIDTYINASSFNALHDDDTADSNPLSRLVAIKTEKDFEQCIARGKQKRYLDNKIAQNRLKTSVLVSVQLPSVHDKTLSILFGEGDFSLFNSASAFAQKSPHGIGMMLRHDYFHKKTFAVICCTERANAFAFRIAKDLTNNISNGGTYSCACGYWDQLVFPQIQDNSIVFMNTCSTTATTMQTSEKETTK